MPWKGVEYDFILSGPDVLDIFDYPSSDEDEDDDSDEEEEEQEEEAETTEEGLLVPDKDDVDYYEEPIEIDDHFHLIEHDYLQANSTNGVQRLVSMTKTSFAHQDPGSSVASTSAGKASTSAQAKQSTPSQASAPPKQGRGRPRKNPPKEVKNPRGPYKKYTDKLIVKFLETVQNVTLNVRKAAGMKKIEIPYHTALRYWKCFTSGEPYLPSQLNKKGGSKPILTEEHTQFLLAFYDEDATPTLKQARQALQETFGVWITLSGLHKHLVEKCSLIMKKLEKHSSARNSPETKEKRADWAKWTIATKIDYHKCVFIDEAGFNLHIKRNFERSKRGHPPRAMIPKYRGVTITILGAITSEGVVHLGMRKPQQVTGQKRAKTANGETRVVGKVGTRSEHFQAFVEELMDVLDGLGMQKRILVLDNATIHKTKAVQDAILSRGHSVLYLPPWSPVFNPIELFWSKLKAGVKRETLTTEDTLTDRIVKSSHLVTATDCYGWIEHSTSFFERAINMEDL